jgi:catechol 2,3-dioxygenase-like lactoylglutathione lyase family enzyme
MRDVALIASDYEMSQRFYVELPGCQVLAENYHVQIDS